MTGAGAVRNAASADAFLAQYHAASPTPSWSDFATTVAIGAATASVPVNIASNAYNSFGEVTGRSMNGVQFEYAEYDKSGAVLRTKGEQWGQCRLQGLPNFSSGFRLFIDSLLHSMELEHYGLPTFQAVSVCSSIRLVHSIELGHR